MQLDGKLFKGSAYERGAVKNEAEEADGEENAVAGQMSPPDERN